MFIALHSGFPEAPHHVGPPDPTRKTTDNNWRSNARFRWDIRECIRDNPRERIISISEANSRKGVVGFKACAVTCPSQFSVESLIMRSKGSRYLRRSMWRERNYRWRWLDRVKCGGVLRDMSCHLK
jgi:hypothetical protein